MSDTKRKRTPSFKRAKLVERPARKISQPEILTLISAIKKNNINEVNEFLKSENQNNDFKQNGLNMTPLHYAVQGKNVKIVKLMIDHGYGKINDKNQLYKTPLDLALENNSLEIFKCLIENESENCSDLFFLHKVVKKGNLEILKYLLANGAEVNIFTKEKNESPLSCAICKGNTEMVIELLKYGAKNKKCYINAKLVKDDILILLLKAGHSMENYFGTQIPLIVAVEMGSWKLIKFLIESNIDVNSQTNLYNIVFSIALTNGNSKIVRILLAAGADPIGKIKIKNSIEFLIHQKLWTNLQKIQILQHILNYCPIKYLDLTILSYIELAIKEKTSAHLIDMLINCDFHNKFKLKIQCLYCENYVFMSLMIHIQKLATLIEFQKLLLEEYLRQGEFYIIKSTRKILISRIVFLKSISENFNIDEEIHVKFINTFQLEEWNKCCQEEIEIMKKTKVLPNESEMMYYDFLTKPLYKLEFCVANKKLMKNLENFKNFQMYEEFFKRRVNEVIIRSKYSVSCKELFYCLVRKSLQIHLPSEILDNICSYLSVFQLRRFSEAFHVLDENC